MKKKVITFLCIAISIFIVWEATPFVLLAGSGIISGYNRPKHGKIFARSLWDKYPRERIHFVDDFLSKNNLTGMTRDKVIELLGEPRGGEINEEDHIGYYVGDDGVDPLVLDIYFDKDKKVNTFGVYQH